MAMLRAASGGSFIDICIDSTCQIQAHAVADKACQLLVSAVSICKPDVNLSTTKTVNLIVPACHAHFATCFFICLM